MWLKIITVTVSVAAVAGLISLAQADQALIRVNYYRGMAGVSPVSLDSSLNTAAQRHAWYCAYEGVLTHEETDTANPYYSGRWPRDRATAAGYPPYDPNTGEYYVAENGYGALGPAAAVDAWMGGAYHRWIIIHPDAWHMGYGEAKDKIECAFLDVGFKKFALHQPVYYPRDGQTGVPTDFIPESPNPIPQDPDGKAGYPITVSLPLWSTVTITSYELEDKTAGQPVAHYALIPTYDAQGNPTNPYLWNSVALVAKDPLNPGTTYQARVAGSVTAKYPLTGSYNFDKTWTFTTVAAPPPNLVGNPGFEVWPVGDLLPTPWEIGVKHEAKDTPEGEVRGDPNAIHRVEYPLVRSGELAIQLGSEGRPAAGEGYGIISQDIGKIIPGQTYEFSLWAMGGNDFGPLSARAYVWWLGQDAAGNYYYLYPPTDPRSRIEIILPSGYIPDYQRFVGKGQVQAPKDAVAARIQIGKYSWGFIRVDDVSLIPK